ncbi:MAG: calcium-binding protein [Syntrophotaleaceae bacterium]
MAMKVEYYLKTASASALSYVELKKKETDGTYIAADWDGVDDKTKSENQKEVDAFLKANPNITIVKQMSDPTSDLSITVFEEKIGEETKKTIAVRGTKLSDVGDLITDAVIASGLSVENGQFYKLEEFYNSLVKDGTISAGEKVDITGHSLGGFLTQIFTAKYPEAVNHATTFNAPGIGGLTAQVLKNLGILPENYDTNQITNIIADGGDEIIAGMGVLLGKVVKIPGWTHFIDDVVDTLKCMQERGLTPNDFNSALPLGPQLFVKDIFQAIQNLFSTASTATQPRRDPLILDLDGDGIATTPLSAGTYFDLDRNGFAEKTSWAGADDGFLVMDRNGDGNINDGGELFGDQTILQNGATASHGFEALAEWDDNADGKIDATDAIWGSLKVWQETNGDGFSSAAELRTLDELGIAAINLDNTAVDITDENGNTVIQSGTFEKTDGSTGQTGSFLLQRDPALSVATEQLEVPELIAALPNLPGMGNISSLHQAMVRDASGTLQSLVESFLLETEPAARETLMEQILFTWTGCDAIDSASRGDQIDARQLVMLEKCLAQDYEGTSGVNPDSTAAPYLQASFQSLFESCYAQLMTQSHLKSLYEMITVSWDATTLKAKGDLKAVIAELENQLALDAVKGQELFEEFTRTLGGLHATEKLNLDAYKTAFVNRGDEFTWALESVGKNKLIGTSANDTITGLDNDRADALWGGAGDDILNSSGGDDYLDGGAGNDELWAGTGDDVLHAGSGNDYLHGGIDHDLLYGEAGDDVLDGNSGNDVLDGGTGNDELNGGSGNDRYLFGIGSGQDTLYDYCTDSGQSDTVEFGADISANDLELYREGSQLRIAIKGTNDALNIERWFDSSYYRIEKFQFADGTTLSADSFLNLGLNTIGTAGNDEPLNGTSSNDILHGLAGADDLYGQSGNDTLLGGEGNDYLNGSSGNDILDGGTGDDYLNGGTGSDRYLFGIGSGHDKIHDEDTSTTPTDIVQFGEGISVADLKLYQEGEYLRIRVNEASDSLRIRYWFTSTGKRVERFEFADGTVLTANDINAMGIHTLGTEGNDDPINGTSFKDTLHGLAGNDRLFGQSGNDTLLGGEGNDYLNGSSGNDILDGGTGDDYLNGGTGSDRYLFGLGSGHDKIHDEDTSTTPTDIVQFGEGISVADLKLYQEGEYLRIRVNEADDSLRIRYWFTSTGKRVERFEFADGTVLTANDINAMGIHTLGTEGNDDPINGTSFKDTLHGLAGNDRLFGQSGNDTLLGGEGNDYLNGSSGNDILDGGTGDDYLNGGTGSDRYLFGLGGGQDTINDYDSGSGQTDTVEFSLDPLALIFNQTDNNLQIDISNSSDSLTVKNWFAGANYQTEVFTTADGSQLLNSQVNQLIQAMTTFCSDNGTTWEQAIQERPDDVQIILAAHWQPAA